MSRRARQRAQARPWDRLFDNSDADQIDVDALIAATHSDDQHTPTDHTPPEPRQPLEQPCT